MPRQSITLTAEQDAWVRTVAKSLGVPFSLVVRRIIQGELDTNKDKNGRLPPNGFHGIPWSRQR